MCCSVVYGSVLSFGVLYAESPRPVPVPVGRSLCRWIEIVKQTWSCSHPSLLGARALRHWYRYARYQSRTVPRIVSYWYRYARYCTRLPFLTRKNRGSATFPFFFMPLQRRRRPLPTHACLAFRAKRPFQSPLLCRLMHSSLRCKPPPEHVPICEQVNIMQGPVRAVQEQNLRDADPLCPSFDGRRRCEGDDACGLCCFLLCCRPHRAHSVVRVQAGHVVAPLLQTVLNLQPGKAQRVGIVPAALGLDFCGMQLTSVLARDDAG